MAEEAAATQLHQGAAVDLRYVARAGLLPELSGQTYDSFYKALREAVLNAADAGAHEVVIDFSAVANRAALSVHDDGSGMSLNDLCDHFMSLGGSSKFGDGGLFGRIGIGSLALLQYADAAQITTKVAGAGVATSARISHQWRLDRDDRRLEVGEVPAGTAQDLSYAGPREDHFTHLDLEDVSPEIAEVASDPASFFELVDTLRRVLPLPWTPSELWQALSAVDPAMVGAVRTYVDDWSVPVTVVAPWGERIALTRRSYGDAASGTECWTGSPKPVMKVVRVADDVGSRKLLIGGYMLNQEHPSPDWTGLTIRVQNVAVETASFFDVTSDPGFRKYISGEIFLMGELDRHRLINIDRCSFNRECDDYRAVARYMRDAIVRFKSEHVQAPQRAKVGVRRAIEQHKSTVSSVRRVLDAAFERLGPISHGGLPSSGCARLSGGPVNPVVREVVQQGGTVHSGCDVTAPASKQYSLTTSHDGTVIATVNEDLLDPEAPFGSVHYALHWYDDPGGPPVVIRNRPREIQINMAHEANRADGGSSAVLASLALEISYTYSVRGEITTYDAMLCLLESL